MCVFFPSVHTRIKRKSILVRRKVICNKFPNPSAAAHTTTMHYRKNRRESLAGVSSASTGTLYITQNNNDDNILWASACCTIVSDRKNKPPPTPGDESILLLLLSFSLFARSHRAVVLTYGPCAEPVSFLFTAKRADSGKVLSTTAASDVRLNRK